MVMYGEYTNGTRRGIHTTWIRKFWSIPDYQDLSIVSGVYGNIHKNAMISNDRIDKWGCNNDYHPWIMVQKGKQVQEALIYSKD